MQGLNEISVNTKRSLKTPQLKSAPAWSTLGDNVAAGGHRDHLRYLH